MPEILTLDKHVIAIDRSGSTSWQKSEFYWRKVKEYLSALEDKTATCILWNDGEPENMKAEEILKLIERSDIPEKIIYGCTDPSTFVELIADNAEIDLTLFTDGEIDEGSVKKCAKLLLKKNIHINKLDTYLVNLRQNINLSVVAPFLREEFIPADGCMAYTEFLQDLSTTNNTDGHQVSHHELKPFIKEITNCTNDLNYFLSLGEKFVNNLHLQNFSRTDDYKDVLKQQLATLKKQLFLLNEEKEKKDEDEKEKKDQNKQELTQNISEKLKKSSALIKDNVEQREIDRIEINKELEKLTDALKGKEEVYEKIEQIFNQCFTVLDPKSGYQFNRNITASLNTQKTSTEEVGIPSQLGVDEITAEAVSENSAIDQKYVCSITFQEDTPLLGIKALEQEGKIRYAVPLSDATLQDLVLKEYTFQVFSSKNPDPRLVSCALKKIGTQNPSKDKIKALLVDPDFKKRIVQHFTEDRYAKKMVAFYKKDLSEEILNVILSRFEFIKELIKLFSDKQYDHKLISLDKSELEKRLEISLVLFKNEEAFRSIVQKEVKLKLAIEALINEFNFTYAPAQEYLSNLLSKDEDSLKRELEFLLEEFVFFKKAKEKIKEADIKDFILNKYASERKEIEKEAIKEESVQQAVLTRAVMRLRLDILDNPLLLLTYPELVKMIEQRLANPIGLKSIYSVLEAKGEPPEINYFKTPEGRESISSVLTLEDTETHKKSRLHALDDLFFGGKGLCGEPATWLNILYLIVKNCPRLNEVEDIDDIKHTSFSSLLRKATIDHLYQKETYLTLSSLPEDGPVYKVPFAVALWYCVQSPYLKKADKHYVPNRLHAIGTKYHLDLLDALNLPYDRSVTWHQLARYRVADWMLEQTQINRENLNKWCRTLYQNSMNYHGEIILLDGSPAVKPLHVAVFENGKKLIDTPTIVFDKDDNEKLRREGSYIDSLSIEEVLKIHQLVLKRLDDVKTGNKKLKDLIIEDDFSPLKDIPKPVANYSKEENETSFSALICPATLKPHLNDPLENRDWQEIAQERFGPLEKQISLNRLFFKYIECNDKIPSKEQFILYLYKQSRFDTLPKLIEEKVDRLYESYITALKFYGIELADSLNLFKEKIKLLKIEPKNFKKEYLEQPEIKESLNVFIKEKIKLLKDKRQHLEKEYLEQPEIKEALEAYREEKDNEEAYFETIREYYESKNKAMLIEKSASANSVVGLFKGLFNKSTVIELQQDINEEVTMKPTSSQKMG